MSVKNNRRPAKKVFEVYKRKMIRIEDYLNDIFEDLEKGKNPWEC